MLPPPAPIAACRNLLILFTTAPSTSPAADVSVSTAKKLISAPSSRDKLSVSRRSKKVFGSSALWITISGTSIWRKKLCSLSTTLLAQKCYLCSRYVLSPMSPGRTKGFWWTRGDSNPRPPRCERGALPAELLAHEQHVKFSKRLMPCQRAVFRGRALSHRIPLARLKCVSPKRRLEMAARLGGEPAGGRKLESSGPGY